MNPKKLQAFYSIKYYSTLQDGLKLVKNQESEISYSLEIERVVADKKQEKVGYKKMKHRQESANIFTLVHHNCKYIHIMFRTWDR